MHETDVVLLGVLAAVAVFLVLAYRIRVPYPILLVVLGCGLGFVPGVPDVRLDPQLVLTLILPPLLYSAAFFSSLRDLRANLRPISLLSIGLVLATTVAVAVVAHAVVPGMSWPVAFVLGAVVSPTDPVAASAIARRLGAPRRFVTVVEGESLVNDSTALIAYKFAVVAVVTGGFSAPHAVGRFLVNALVGVAIGLVVGWLVAAARRAIEEPATEITISLLTPYFAYLPAEASGVSAVLAAVSAGVYLGWHSPELISPSTRIQAFAVWEILVFVLNSTLFVLLGLQLPNVLHAISSRPAGELAVWAAIVAATVILVRIAWVFPLTYLPRVLSRRIRERDPYPSWRGVVLVAWTGMRGAVSLAAALAIPFTTGAGTPFPQRDLVIFLTYAVILATLILQGLSLPLVIRALGVRDDGSDEHWENKARLIAARAAIARLEELGDEDWIREGTLERMLRMYEFRIRRFTARFDDGDDGEIDQQSLGYQRLRREVLEAERAEIIRLRKEGRINDEVMHRIERDLDLEDTRLEVPQSRS